MALFGDAADGTDRSLERGVLAFGLVTGVLGVVLAVNDFASAPELDFHAYYFTGKAILEGEPFVGWAITDISFLTEKAYVYTPVTAPLFVPFALFPEWQIPYVLNMLLLFGVFFAIGRLCLQLLDDYGMTLDRVDRVLIMAFCLFSGHTVLGVYRGNVDPAILLVLAVGLLAIERGRGARGGALWGGAALFKLFPAFLGVYLLYRRAYRAIAAAVVVGVGFTLLGVAIFGIDAHVDFVEFILHERSREGAFRGGLDPTLQWITLRRPFSQVLALSGNQLFLLTTALVAPVVYLVYREADSELDRIVAFFATMVAMLITIIPSTLNYVVYLYFPLVPLLYLVEDRRTKLLFVAGMVLVNVPLYPHHVATILEALPLSPGIADALADAVRAVLRWASIPLYGFLLILAGCVSYARTPAPAAAAASPTPEPGAEPGVDD
ncbi:hypothetical protein BRD19_12890 [Halobacteriales archaeon SW_7_65_23]|nr:MAG: hypothetical protein BRD19_12890 [Halobacteriales archaeon SW_7_65_23]